MATTITAGNSTNGAAISSDNTGTLDIKTGTGAGTTAISIDASQNVAIPGTLTVGGFPAGGNYVMNDYVAPATWSKPAGLKAVKVTVVGAGGAGGAPAVPGAAGNNPGGGAGGAAIVYLAAPSIPGPVAITAGPGTNSFGAFASGTAGTAGFSGNTQANSGGAGGTGSVSPTIPAGQAMTFVGSSGQIGFSIPANNVSYAGNGGTSIFGNYGAGAFANPVFPGFINGGAATGFGGGGGGGAKQSPTVGASSGGAGSPGIVIVEEFY